MRPVPIAPRPPTAQVDNGVSRIAVGAGFASSAPTTSGVFGEKTRRGRKRYSCSECRRLKLRCSKSWPCTMCLRRGFATSCPGDMSEEGRPSVAKMRRTSEVNLNKQLDDGDRTAAARPTGYPQQDLKLSGDPRPASPKQHPNAVERTQTSAFPVVSPEVEAVWNAKGHFRLSSSPQETTRGLGLSDSAGSSNGLGNDPRDKDKARQSEAGRRELDKKTENDTDPATDLGYEMHTSGSRDSNLSERSMGNRYMSRRYDVPDPRSNGDDQHSSGHIRFSPPSYPLHHIPPPHHNHLHPHYTFAFESNAPSRRASAPMSHMPPPSHPLSHSIPSSIGPIRPLRPTYLSPLPSPVIPVGRRYHPTMSHSPSGHDTVSATGHGMGLSLSTPFRLGSLALEGLGMGSDDLDTVVRTMRACLPDWEKEGLGLTQTFWEAAGGATSGSALSESSRSAASFSLDERGAEGGDAGRAVHSEADKWVEYTQSASSPPAPVSPLHSGASDHGRRLSTSHQQSHSQHSPPHSSPPMGQSSKIDARPGRPDWIRHLHPRETLEHYIAAAYDLKTALHPHELACVFLVMALGVVFEDASKGVSAQSRAAELFLLGKNCLDLTRGEPARESTAHALLLMGSYVLNDNASPNVAGTGGPSLSGSPLRLGREGSAVTGSSG